MTNNSGPKIEVARSLDEVAALRSVWESMQAPPDADLDFFLTLFKTRSEFLRPHVISVKSNDTLESILVGRIERTRITVGLGYGRVALPPVRCLTLIGSGLLGVESPENNSALVRSIRDSLKKGEADIARFHNLKVGSSIHKAVSGAGGILRRDYFPSFADHWKVKLPPTYEEFIRQRSSNARHNLKRYSKRFKDLFGERIVIRRFRGPQDIEELMSNTEIVARMTYHRGLNAGFIDDEETRLRMQLYANQGRLRAHILYIGTNPIAFWNGFLYGRTFYTWTTGYDPEYREFRPGQFLLQEVFGDLCAENAVNEVDFGSGDAQYKRDWCDENHPEVSMYLFGSSIRSSVLNMLRTPLIAFSHAARWGVNQTGLLQKAKKLWRSYLERRSKLEIVR